LSEVVSNLTDPLLIIGLGVLGGGLAELVKWYKIKDSANIGDYKNGAIYWVITILMILAGGALAWIWSLMGNINAILAVNVGASAPLIIAGVLNTPPPTQKTPTPTGLGIAETAIDAEKKGKAREFISWR
jgi:hypothetical protein